MHWASGRWLPSGTVTHAKQQLRGARSPGEFSQLFTKIGYFARLVQERRGHFFGRGTQDHLFHGLSRIEPGSR